MANLAKTTIFASTSSPKETALDKTTRIVKRMNDEDAEKRRLKTTRLKWSGKFGQRAKMYPTRTNGYENDKATELFRPV